MLHNLERGACIHLLKRASDSNFNLLFWKKLLPFSKSVSAKGGRALRGYFGPPMRPKNENCFSQVSSYWFIRTIAKV